VRAAWLWVTCLWAACTCKPPVTNVESRFRVGADSQLVDFGRVLEGTVVTKPVTLFAETRVDVTVTASTRAPFSAPRSVEVPGGSQVDLEVAFRAGNGEAADELLLVSGTQQVRVALRGLGVRPPSCVASAPCRLSSFDLAQGRCVETVAADDAACEPLSQCLEQGRCRAGQCLGIARRCDDNDACTTDACAMDAGCVHPRVRCPPPTNPCRVPTCDARSGCGEAVAPDGTPCGTLTCVTAKVCVMGQCSEIPTPDGTECGPAVACSGVSTCRQQKCQRPDAGPWLPTWTARVDGTPVDEAPGLLGFGGSVFFTACGLTPLPADGGAGDAGAREGDGGTPGAGGDGGRDAGALEDPRCAVLSYTGTGFDRFIARTAQRERLVQVGPAGVVLLVDGGLGFRSVANGTWLGGWQADGLVPSAVASMSDGGVVVAIPTDAGARLLVLSPMGVSALVDLDSPVSHLAVDVDDSVFALTGAPSVVRLHGDDDGGRFSQRWPLLAPSGSLSVAFGTAVAGGLELTSVEVDAGLRRVSLEPLSDGGLASAKDVSLSGTTVFVVFKACPVPLTSCAPEDEATFLRASSRTTGALRWQDTLAPGGVGARLVEAAVLGLPMPTSQGVAAVVSQLLADGGVQSGLLVTVDGSRALECPMPEGTGTLHAGLFTQGQLLTLATRPDGGVTLAAWPLGALSLERSGWPQTNGTSGQRRALP